MFQVSADTFANVALKPTTTLVRKRDGTVEVHHSDGTVTNETRRTDQNQNNLECDGREFYVIDTKPDHQCAEILPWLFLSSQDVPAYSGAYPPPPPPPTVPTAGAVKTTATISPRNESNDDAKQQEKQQEGQEEEQRQSILRFHGIRRILNVACRNTCSYPLGPGIERVDREMFDTPEFSLFDNDDGSNGGGVLDDCLDLLDEWKGEGFRCLVHCNAGASRSAAVVMAWLVT